MRVLKVTKIASGKPYYIWETDHGNLRTEQLAEIVNIKAPTLLARYLRYGYKSEYLLAPPGTVPKKKRPVTMVTLICDWCGEVFSVEKTNASQGRRFCTKACANTSRAQDRIEGTDEWKRLGKRDRSKNLRKIKLGTLEAMA